MRVAVRPCFAPGVSGGIEQYVRGLARGLSRLEGADRFDFVGTGPQRSALADYLDGAASWVTLAPPRLHAVKWYLARRIVSTPLGPTARRVRVWARSRPRRPGQSAAPAIPASPPKVEAGGYDVVHFAAQAGERTALAKPLPTLGSAAPPLSRVLLRGRPQVARGALGTVLQASHLCRRRVSLCARRRRRGLRDRPGAGRCRSAGCPTVGRAGIEWRQPAVRPVPSPAVEPQEPPSADRRRRVLVRSRHRATGCVHRTIERA